MEIGLTERELALIRSVFRHHPEIVEVRLFGSRALGTNRPNSDIDLACSGLPDSLAVEKVRGELEELPLPYRFDLLGTETLTHQELKDHINRVGVPVYAKRLL